MKRNPYPLKLTRAGRYLAQLLEQHGKPVLTPFDFFRIIWQMYRESPGKNLYLRSNTPTRANYTRLKSGLKQAGVIGPDRDYNARIIRVLSLSDLPAEDIICLIDPTCYVSHLSAMQRWGLTNRNPHALILTRPDRKTVAKQLREYRTKALGKEYIDAFPLIIGYPTRVRGRTVRIYESKSAGAFLNNQGTDMRLSAIGQTFLDMLQKPDLCGGMHHVLEVWDEHANTYLDHIVAAVNTATSGLVKTRAGYILEERQGLQHRGIENWKAFAQRGGSRKLDPARDFAPTFSETWMLSLNV